MLQLKMLINSFEKALLKINNVPFTINIKGKGYGSAA